MYVTYVPRVWQPCNKHGHIQLFGNKFFQWSSYFPAKARAKGWPYTTKLYLYLYLPREVSLNEYCKECWLLLYSQVLECLLFHCGYFGDYCTSLHTELYSLHRHIPCYLSLVTPSHHGQILSQIFQCDSLSLSVAFLLQLSRMVSCAVNLDCKLGFHLSLPVNGEISRWRKVY